MEHLAGVTHVQNAFPRSVQRFKHGFHGRGAKISDSLSMDITILASRVNLVSWRILDLECPGIAHLCPADQSFVSGMIHGAPVSLS
ncbi:MAG: hypothetical protein AUF79_01690 [Crenarchaeota archaeon 13_1_20CM_2_51_8]|nr:MAG: hypothetical protein AUF79_01690 [Crenarchaeota archaeon 13_1_20CM_2_51_8]